MRIRGKGKKISKEKTAKKERVAPYVPKPLIRKMDKLALACDLKRNELGIYIWELALNNPDFIKGIQDRFNVPSEDRITPIIENGKVYY